MATMRVIQVPASGADFEGVDREMPEPGPRDVRVRVNACGICHSDAMAKEGMSAAYPRVPGHEIAGVVDAVGADVDAWSPGQRVGVGWFGGADYTCDACRRGDFIDCANLRTPGLTDDGGYADFAVFPADALAAIPDELSDIHAAPLMCAGVTTFNGLRRTRARAGELVAVLGIGGLGHLGVQFAARMGFETVAIARGDEKRDFARELGAHHYIDSTASDVGQELTKLGGASVVLATVTHGPSMAATIPGLRARGELVVLGAAMEPLEVPPVQLIMQSRVIAGHPSGTSKDSEDTLRFAALTGITPMVETMSMSDAADGYERMMSGDARFRVVLTNG
ncbi:MAG TPA: alcohol dehydrogenase catalytic domain-containing protein [Frankiaceae bacterium]|nr:alcohol dehydrogenase catalytic domain-containing protein [Frankiaceae bacterium]